MSGRELLAPSVPLRGRQVTRAAFDQLKRAAVVLTLIFITQEFFLPIPFRSASALEDIVLGLSKNVKYGED